MRIYTSGAESTSQLDACQYVCRALIEDDLRMTAELAQAKGDIEAAAAALEAIQQHTLNPGLSPVAQVANFHLLHLDALNYDFS